MWAEPMSENVDIKKLQFQSILAAHTVVFMVGHEKTPMTAAADKVALYELGKRISFELRYRRIKKMLTYCFSHEW